MKQHSWPYTKTLYGEEVGGYLFDEIEIGFEVGDCGIGSYEFWGHRGCDSRIGIVDWEITNVKLADGQEDPPADLEAFLEKHDVIDLVEPED